MYDCLNAVVERNGVLYQSVGAVPLRDVNTFGWSKLSHSARRYR